MQFDQRPIFAATRTQSRLIAILVALVLLIGLPLVGVAWRGESLAAYLAFPPRTQAVVPAPFSWAVAAPMLIAVLAFVTPFAMRLARIHPRASAPVRAFPLWGYFGVTLIVAAWVLAWTRFPWFSDFQHYTFGPLWLGYILVINALTCQRTGHCLLRDRPGRLAALFILSIPFWWYFEYLNGYVHNWHYVGLPSLTDMDYFWQASLAFSVVLPGVMSARDWLASFPRLDYGLAHFRPLRARHSRAWAWLALFAAAAALVLLGVWPQYLYVMVWVAPVLLIAAVQSLYKRRTLFHPLRRGDWRALMLPALAALVCGFFWELWNYRSLAHWEYAVPFVGQISLFEMPLLGYAGYLPFGMACAVFVDFILPGRERG
jgi:hypothetical protein